MAYDDALYSESILKLIETAMRDLGVLAGSKRAPAHVERFDAEKGRSADLPGIRISRGEESLSGLGSSDKYSLGEHVECAVTVAVWVFALYDRSSSESYDELVALDVGTVIRKLLTGIDWYALKVNPLPFAWSPIQIESEETVEDGAVIRFTPRWRSPVADLGDRAEAWLE